MKKALFKILLIFGLLVPSIACADRPQVFDYTIMWNGIYAGTSTLALTPDGKFTDITSSARSANFISLFFKVNDLVESKLDTGSFTPVSYKMQLREGKRVRDKEVSFTGSGTTGGKIYYTDIQKNEKAQFDSAGRVFDPLSSFFYVRTLPLVVGKSVFVKVFDSKKLYDVEIKVLKKEQVRTWMGTYNAILVKPVMKSEGIFLSKGDIEIWLSDDANRIPLMLRTTVGVGAITAVLKHAQF